jgi:DNA-binding response OmpR family regulator
MNQAGLTPSASPIGFGIFEVDFASGELRRQGVRIKLQEQPFQALIALLQRPREVLTREELRKTLISKVKPGKDVDLVVLRKGERVTLKRKVTDDGPLPVAENGLDTEHQCPIICSCDAGSTRRST